MNRRFYSTVFALAGAAGAAWFVYRRWSWGLQPMMTPEVRAKLPLAKDLETVSDVTGNYDIDGVSFDTEGVIVASDLQKPVESMI